ncbi:Protein pelota homolog [Strongyloides ratti]|uniref:Protein pelota homolog n=1 Tax=Strongyloides ratti TaxID=34506 RepID=A0A090LCP3_STRRB|nr:Protein pelota homolog [Strongyloides ratti]CEF67537.1 Protein pelota homolog [Strongyloides ratti]
MKLLGKYINKDKSGSIKVLLEEEEDMWQFYNLIRVGDLVKASTVRKVIMESETRSNSSQKINMNLVVAVETISFDPTTCTLHLKGKNTEKNDYVKLGQYHTLDIELGKTFTLHKEQWDSIDFHRLDECQNTVSKKADVAAIIMHEGLAHVCLLTDNLIMTKAKIEISIPGKRKGYSSQHDKALERFYKHISNAFIKTIDFDIVKCIIIASPGFYKDSFYDYLQNFMENNNKKMTQEEKNKFLLVHSTNGFKHSIKEVLTDPNIQKKLGATKSQQELNQVLRFQQLLNVCPEKAFYGPRDVIKASNLLAIETLLISDSLFRSHNLEERAKYVKLVENVKKQGQNVYICSSQQLCGEQLNLYSGVAAILKYPMPELENDNYYSSDSSS